MYWYLSFLRPPPVTIPSLAQSITITPQVANDLRTEIRYYPTEIYYTWQLVSPKFSSPLKEQHLTTYRSPESTYKAIPIPLPPAIRVGQKWRLGLFSASSSSAAGPSRQRIRDILKSAPDLDVIGVWSEPMEVVGPGSSGSSGSSSGVDRPAKKSKTEVGKSKGKGKAKEDEGPKQTRIHREWSTGSGGDGPEGRLRIIEQTSFDLDKKIWDSGLALSAWLGHHLAGSSSSPYEKNEKLSSMLRLLTNSAGSRDLRILEIGSGTGLVSIALRQILHGMDAQRGDVEITATDLDSAMELMNENIALNNIDTPFASEDLIDVPESPAGTVSLSAKILDWDADLPSWVTSNHPDIIVAADVTYNTASFPCLVKTLCSLLQPSSGERPPLLLAYKQRDEAERDLWTTLADKGIELELVDRVQGAEQEGEVEIWLGGSTKSDP